MFITNRPLTPICCILDVSTNYRLEVKPLIKYRNLSLQENVVIELQELSDKETKKEGHRVTLSDIARKALKAYQVQAQKERSDHA
jgi:hypothetical protein